MKRINIIIVTLLINYSLFSQYDSTSFLEPISLKTDIGKSLGFISGIGGFNQIDLEIGLGYNFVQNLKKVTGYKPYLGPSLSIQKQMTNKDLITYNLDIWAKNIFILGFNLSLTSNKIEQTMGLKPFVGIGYKNISFIYGYKFYTEENKIEGLYNNFFSIRYYLPLIKYE